MIQKLSERMICSFCNKTLAEAGCMVSSADMKTFRCGLCCVKLREFALQAVKVSGGSESN